MPFCTHCGSAITDKDIYCTNCGTKIGMAAIATDEDTEDDEDDIIYLDDENGVPTKFEFLDLIEHAHREWLILSPADDGADSSDVVILQVIRKPNGEESYITSDDMQLLSAVFEKFKKKNADRFNFG